VKFVSRSRRFFLYFLLFAGVFNFPLTKDLAFPLTGVAVSSADLPTFLSPTRSLGR